MSVKVEKITEAVALGEGPHWSEREQALYFVSILDKSIHKYVPATGDHTRTKLDGRVGFIIPVEGKPNQFVVGVELKVVVISWDGRDGSKVSEVTQLAEVEEGSRNRFNDAKVDPKGRLYAGTMGPEEPLGTFDPNQGSLYQITPALQQLASGVSISNGLAWDTTSNSFYYVDSLERKIRRYDWDAATGNISNKTYIFDLEKQNVTGLPDGMTIDTDGNLWVAVFNGSAVIKVDPKTGSLLQKVDIPAPQVTSVTFGGKNFDTLFVTTANLDINCVSKPPAGSCFKVTGLGVKGHPNCNFKF